MMEAFRRAVRERSLLIGTFVKTASHQVVEVLGRGGLDFVVVDWEHAPFDLGQIDLMALAARSADLPCLVRVPELSMPTVGAVLDLGAAGVLVPHVQSAEAAEAALAAAKFAPRRRGFSPSPRAGGYGTIDPAAYRRQADVNTSVWCQIEDAEGLAQIDAIAAVDSVDCLFIGRADLALSLGVESPSDPVVQAAVQTIVAAGRTQRRSIGIFIADTAEIPAFVELGISVFVQGSDQSFLLAESRRAKAALAGPEQKDSSQNRSREMAR